MKPSPPKLQEMPEEATAVFPDVERARHYAELLAGRGQLAGVIGPRENERMWTRHLLNSTTIAPLLHHGAAVADVGTGAGLPGIPLAIARPDLHVHLVESLARRIRFLAEAVATLDLGERVTLHHARAEDLHRSLQVDVVVSRAVADPARLLQWCWPLTRKNGEMIAMRGSDVEAELAALRPELARRRLTGEALSVPGAIPDASTHVLRIRTAPRSLTRDAVAARTIERS